MRSNSKTANVVEFAQLDIAERYLAENYLANRMQHLENRMAMRSLGGSTFFPCID
jgi:hypothetical protein